MADDQDDLDSGLFNISLASSDPEDGDTSHQTAWSTSPRDRTGQSEDQFQAVKQSYRAKIENGELPLGRRKVSKHEAQELLHAVEELYFYKRYDEGAALVRRMLEGEGGAQGVDKDTRALLRRYETKCLEKLGRDTTSS